MSPESRVFRLSDPDAPTTPALRERLAQLGRYEQSAAEKARATRRQCLLCGCSIENDNDADLGLNACSSCKSRPEANRLRDPQPPRGFTDAEKALIRKINGYVPASQLLKILNDRLISDLGQEATPHTTEQLHAEIAAVTARAANAGTGWAMLRKLLSVAERDGTLKLISEDVIQDFAIVFSLSPKQVMRLKDILLQQTEED
jgi:hypothetical protein